MEKGYRAVSRRGMVTAIASGVNTMAKIAFTALAVVGTIYATGNIGAGLEVGKRLIYV